MLDYVLNVPFIVSASAIVLFFLFHKRIERAQNRRRIQQMIDDPAIRNNLRAALQEDEQKEK